MGVFLDDIPGYRESLEKAEQEESLLRDLAMLGLPVKLCGVECNQFTPRHYMMLVAAQSPFICGGDIEPEHVAQFLWVVSVCFDSDDADARDFFVALIGFEVEFNEATVAIEKYLADAFMDRPPSIKRARNSPSVSFAASMVHYIAQQYGWSVDEILDKPLAQLYQFLKCQCLDRNPNAPNMSPRVAKITGDILRKHIEETNGKRDNG